MFTFSGLVLGYLSSPDCAPVKVAGAGAIDIVMSAIAKHPLSARVQDNAFWTLYNLIANSDTNRVKIMGADLVQHVLGAMAAHRGEARVQMQAIRLLIAVTSQVHQPLDLATSHDVLLSVQLAIAAAGAEEGTKMWGPPLLAWTKFPRASTGALISR